MIYKTYLYPGRSKTVWYFEGREFGPPPTSIYFWSGFTKWPIKARSLASSRVSNRVGVEIARDFGLGFLWVSEIEQIQWIQLVWTELFTKCNDILKWKNYEINK